MTKHFLLTSAALVCSLMLAAQHQGQSFVLNQPITGGQHTYTATESIRLVPGFSYKPLIPSDFFVGRIGDPLIEPPMDGIYGGHPANDHGGVVGSLAGNLMVSPTGAAVYNIPINLPPGIGTMVPQLALTYNSQGANGLLGLGWGLAGLSSITRTGQTLYHDGKVEGIIFGGDDRYVLDGQRLISVGSNEFRTEVEGFSKITAYGHAGDGPEWFKVQTKTGETLYYGTNPNGRIEATGRPSVLTWHLCKIEDFLGNTIEFDYEKSDGMGRIKTISYGGNSSIGQGHINEVRFYYDNIRPDDVKYFIAGSYVHLNHLLSYISVSAHDESLYAYILEYDKDFYSRLNKVRLINTNSWEYYNPMVFEWGTHGDVPFTEKQVVNELGNETHWVENFFVDINGNGITDIIFVECIPSPPFKTGIDAYYRLVNFDGTLSNKIPIDSPGTFETIITGDFNGDGLGDYIVIGPLTSNEKKITVKSVHYAIENSTSFYGRYAGIHFNALISPDVENDEIDIELGDFNGDGLPEILIAVKNWGYEATGENRNNVFIYTFSSTSSVNKLMFQGEMGFGNSNLRNASVIVSDFTGDGKSEILRTAQYYNTPDHTSNCFVYGVDFQNEIFTYIWSNDGYPTNWHWILPGDFNGDGITDLLTFNYTSSNPKWEIAIMKGLYSGFEEMLEPPLIINPNHPIFNHPNENHLFSISLRDYNNNGRTDILTMYKTGSNEAIYNLFYSNGNQFSPTPDVVGTITKYDNFFTSSGLLSLRRRSTVFPGIDFNGDGFADVYLSERNHNDLILLHEVGNDLTRINTFTNGFGSSSMPSYKPLTNPEVYLRTESSQGQYWLTIQPALYVVDQVSNQISDEVFLTSFYNYEDARLHVRGKGFLGFRKIVEYNNYTPIRTEKTFNIYLNGSPPRFYYPYIEEIKQVNLNGDVVGKQENTLTHINNSNSPMVFFPFIQDRFNIEKEYTSLETVSTSKEEYQYDLLGNLKKIVSGIHTGELTMNAQFTDFDHQNEKNTIYLPLNPDNISRPDIITGSFRYKTNPTIVSTTKYSYYGTSPLVQMVEFRPNGQSWDLLMTRKHFTYDAVGNLKSSTSTAPNFTPAIDPRITSVDYSTDYRFPEHLHDQTGYTVSTQFDTHYGWENSTTNTNDVFNGLNPIAHTHDPLGIFSSVTYPDNTMQVSVWRWAKDHPHAPDDALYYYWEQSTGQSELLVFYNNAGQVLRTSTRGFDGSWVYVDKLYDNRALLRKESMPYFANESPLYTFYSHDAIGRIEDITYPDGTSTRKTYQANTITTTNQGGQTSTQAYNAADWLIESTDDEGTKVHYDYFSDGNLKTTHIVGQQQTTVSMDYNSRRQRSMLNDPNYGLATYTYNPFDELVAQVSPNGQTTSYSYDLVGRMESMTPPAPDGQIQWVFDRADGRLGTLQSVQVPGHQTAYVYDDHLRPLTVTESINGSNYQTQYTYDAFGRIESTIHPSGFGVVNEYNSRGYLRQIRAMDNALLWQTDNTNALGLLTEYQTGNRLATIKSYEPLTKRLSSIITAQPGQSPVQDLGYTWYEVGNLKQRSCNKYNLLEYFTYDNLNRLETISLNGTIRGEHQYDPGGLGNLVYKKADGHVLFDNAAYGENTAGPHALTSAVTTAGIFPPEIQTMAYNSFDKVTAISEGNKTLQISYGHHRQRITQQYTQGSNSINKVWAGACEYITENGQQKTLTYLSGSGGVFALHVINHQTAGQNLYYIHTDHLGSWHTITDEYGNLLQELIFDAWGNRRNPATWRAFTGTPPPPMFDRGFTGHEHLYGFQLINMNGRMYDPVVSRMLSPDNFIQAPDFSQSFNRYSYAWNNPLVYTDPDGELIIPILIGMAKGGTYYFLNHVGQHGNLDNWNWGDFIGAMLAGGVSGYMGPTLAKHGIGGAYGGSILGASAGLTRSVTSGIINKDLKLGNVAANTIGGGILGGGIGAFDAHFIKKGQRWYDGRHPNAHKRYFIPGNEVDGNYYFTEERIRYANDVDYRENSVTGLPRSRKISLNNSDPYVLKRNYDGPLSITGTPSIPEGMEFYISIDGVESVYRRYDNINIPVPLSVKSIEWGFRGERLITLDDIHVINGSVLITMPAIPPTSLSITGYMRPWRGFLFW